MEATVVFISTFAALLGGPILAPFIATGISKQHADFQKRTFLGAGLFILLIAIFSTFNISFTSQATNAVTLSIAYVCCGFLVASLFRIKPKIVGIAVGIFFSLPLALGVGVATGGFIAIGWIAADFETDYETQLPNSLRCVVSTTGNATSAGGNRVRLYERLLPGVERRVAMKFYADDDPNAEVYVSHQNACQSISNGFHR
jgi:hypothetical protein